MQYYIPYTYKGIFIASGILLLWIGNLLSLLFYGMDMPVVLTIILTLLQVHLHTGLFISAHDAMHGTIAPGRGFVIRFIGSICTFLYAFFPYSKLLAKHHAHHDHVHTEDDPDFHGTHFVAWYMNFIREYVSWKQILGYAIVFTLLNRVFQTEELLIFWIIPALLSTMQMFYFGTYLPHKGEHENEFYSASQKRNHFLAFITCYFFGYHYEHHSRPHVPWWQLWRVKDFASPDYKVKEF